MIETATFVCSICGESSADICVYCTKDTCANHRCIRCRRCSDCCECEVPLTASEPQSTDLPLGHPYLDDKATEVPSPGLETVAAITIVEPPPPLPPIELEPAPPSEPLPEPEPAAASADENFPEADKAVPEASTEPSTQEELVKSLPELFAPDTPPPAPPEKTDE